MASPECGHLRGVKVLKESDKGARQQAPEPATRASSPLSSVTRTAVGGWTAMCACGASSGMLEDEAAGWDWASSHPCSQ